jgi:hypothetical protein
MLNKPTRNAATNPEVNYCIISFYMGHGHKGTTALCKISSFRCGIVEALALLGCHIGLVSSLLPLFWDSLLAPSSRVKQS